MTSKAPRDHFEERIRVDPCNTLPYKWICHLYATIPGDVLVGTGFLINIPGSNKHIILTAAHCLYVHKPPSFATNITITFPGQQPITTTDQTCFRVPSEYEAGTHTLNDDYGIIILPEDKLTDPWFQKPESFGFGFDAMLLDRELLNADLSVFGYRGDTIEQIFSEPKQLWGSGGQIQSVDEKTLRYLVQTSKGQSGAPVFIWYKGFWTVVGIHVRFNKLAELTINSAIRLNTFVMKHLVTWISHQFHEISLHYKHRYFVSIPSAAPKKWGDYDYLKFLPRPDASTEITIIPVRAFPGACDKPFSANEWIISPSHIGETYLCIDPFAIPRRVPVESTVGIGLCSHLKTSPLLRRPCEKVHLVKHDGNPGKRELGIESLRFRDCEERYRGLVKRLKLSAGEVAEMEAGEQEREFDIGELEVWRKGDEVESRGEREERLRVEVA